MNYLSHLFLAEDTEESKIGNLLGDFVKGRLNDDFSPEITKGIKTHRKIDLFTDSNETVRQTKKLISPERRKYSGVLIDIFFDHFLTLQWQIYSDKDFDLFVEDTYKILLKYQDIYPFKGKALIPRIVQKDWLRKYGDFDGLSLVFERMSERVKRENPLRGSEQELRDNYSEIEKNFIIFFPELISFVNDIRNEL